MHSLLKHKNTTVWIFIFLLVNSSCVVYNKTPVNFGELDDVSDKKVKVETTTGDIHKVKWIEVLKDSLSMVKNTHWVKIKPKHIKKITIDSEHGKRITLEEALLHQGVIIIQTKSEDYVFFDLRDYGDKVIGYLKKTNQEFVAIPKNQIVEIKLQNKKASRIGNAFIGIGAGIFTMVGIAAISYSQDPGIDLNLGGF